MPFLPDIEPMMPQDRAIERSELPALATQLERLGGELSGAINPVTASVIEDHVRVINSYYSNLIEGHNTHPHDIKKAMLGNYSDDPAKRDLQEESLAHIEVQRWMSRCPPKADQLLSTEYLRQIHQRFYDQLPESLRTISGNGQEPAAVIPGALRGIDQGVSVGRHVPPSGDQLEHYLARFFEAYRIDRTPPYKRPIAAMAAHHRMVWIHPFLDGNGRVARLYTDSFLKTIGIGGCGIWCLSRGLARRHADYKQALAAADEPRNGDTDGRGQLSERRLVEFIAFMLEVAVDQAKYMREVLDLQGVFDRIRAYIHDRNAGLVQGVGPIKPEAARILERAFVLGEFPRGQIVEITGLSHSVSRKVVQQLKEDGLLSETNNRSPLRWAIPEHAERYYFPQLSPT